MFEENPLPAKTFDFLAVRAMPAQLDVQRDGAVVVAVDREHDHEHEPLVRRSIALGLVWLVLAGGCVWSLQQGWIAAAIIFIAFAAFFFHLWWASDRDPIGRELRLDMEADTATLIMGGARRKHRKVGHVPIRSVHLVLCPISGFVQTDRGHEIPTYSGVGLFAVVPGGGDNPVGLGWIMLGAAYDYRELLAAVDRDLPELDPPQQFWQPIRGQLDRILI